MVPACNEQTRIATCLEACAHSADLSGMRVRLLVLINGTTDETIDRALAWSARRRFPLTVVDVDFVPGLAHAGAARRLAMELAGLSAEPGTLLMTTDADALPAPGWVTTNAERLNGGANLVCGRISIVPVELDRLPDQVEVIGQVEGRYKEATLELESLIDPDPWNPWPHHGMASGASLAIRADELRRVGGIPLLQCGEDRALAQAVREHGLSVVHANEVEVEVSCRMVGRARGGMADALLERAQCLNPHCDEALEPAAVLHARLSSRLWLRTIWPLPGDRRKELLQLGGGELLAAELARVDNFSVAWARFEQAVYGSVRRRLRVADLRPELPVLLALLKDIRKQEPHEQARIEHARRLLTRGLTTFDMTRLGRLKPSAHIDASGLGEVS